MKGCLTAAGKYFLLPEISPTEVAVETSDEDFFYSYLDRNKGFMLRGYRIQLENPDDPETSLSAKVIEYIKYHDPEFVP